MERCPFLEDVVSLHMFLLVHGNPQKVWNIEIGSVGWGRRTGPHELGRIVMTTAERGWVSTKGKYENASVNSVWYSLWGGSEVWGMVGWRESASLVFFKLRTDWYNSWSWEHLPACQEPDWGWMCLHVVRDIMWRWLGYGESRFSQCWLYWAHLDTIQWWTIEETEILVSTSETPYLFQAQRVNQFMSRLFPIRLTTNCRNPATSDGYPHAINPTLHIRLPL